MAVLTTTRLGYVALAFFLCLFCSYGALVSADSDDCDEDDVKEDFDICMDAFNDSIEEHLANIKAAPKRIGCCLSSSLGECLKEAYKEEDCDVKDHDVSTAIHNETVKAQIHINKLAKYVGTILCGEMKREHCGESLLHHFDEAVKKIQEGNGAKPVGLSVVLALFVMFVYGFRCI